VGRVRFYAEPLGRRARTARLKAAPTKEETPIKGGAWSVLVRRQLFRSDDESFRGVAEGVEWIAGYECQNIFTVVAKHDRIFGVHNGDELNAIEERSVRRGKSDQVAFANVPQLAEDRVAISGEADVSGVAEHGSSGDVAGSPLKSAIAGAFLDRRFQTDGADFDSA